MTFPEVESEGVRQRTLLVHEGIVEKLCKWAAEIALLLMLGLIGLDIVTRFVFNFSFEIADELGGYLLVLITFVSLSACQVNDAFHHVELVQARLSPRRRAISAVLFDLLALGFSGLLLWQLIRLELTSWRFGERAPTYLETPLWIPRLAMAIGVAALCWSLCRTLLANFRRARSLGPHAHGGAP